MTRGVSPKKSTNQQSQAYDRQLQKDQSQSESCVDCHDFYQIHV